MIAPNILSTTVGMSLPSYDITREVARPGSVSVQAKTRNVVPTKVKSKSVALAFIWSRTMAIILVVANVLCFGFYIYNVNSAQATQYSLLTSQEQVRTLQDKSRQLQVRIAESTAIIRSQQLAKASLEFVAVGTPEFIGRPVASVLTMR